ncbi:MAG: urea transporter [Bacteroidia bacterium]
MIRFSKELISVSAKGLANSYAQLFLSANPVAGVLIGIASFTDPIAGLAGLLMALLTNVLAFLFHLDKEKIGSGSFAFNGLLTGLFLGYAYNISLALLLVIFAGSFLCLMLTVIFDGLLGAKKLPFLSIPFLLSVWILKLSTEGFNSLDPNSTQIFVFNHIYRVGGENLLKSYEFLEALPLPLIVKVYFKSLGAVLFQFSLLPGILVAIAIFIHSRISFSLSILGFLTGYLFYIFIGANLNDLNYGFIGFNFILSAIALGGFFLIPNIWTYLLVIVITPVIAILGIGFEKLLAPFQLPLLSLPFNLSVILFLYFLFFRTKAVKLILTPVQFFSPEKNLYRYINQLGRFGNEIYYKIGLPILGSWRISQGHTGNITHKGDWQYAWDFDLIDEESRTYRLPGFTVEDFYCYNIPVFAPAAGQVVKVVDGIKDNDINQVNLKDNWGNSVVIQHSQFLFSKLSHLKAGTLKVYEGEYITKGQLIGHIGNSGRSPEPHLHYQLQATPYVGSKTLNYPLSQYIVSDKTKHEFVHSGIPQLNEQVSNPSINSLLAEAFNFTPGKKLKWTFQRGDKIETENWDIYTDAYNQTYFYEAKTKSSLFFYNNGTLYENRTFYGDTNSFLFEFYLCSQQVLLAFYKDLSLKNQLEITHIFNWGERFLQDWVAPFYMFLKSEFQLQYTHFDNDISDSTIILKGQINSTRFGLKQSKKEFEIILEHHQLSQIIIKENKKVLSAACTIE